MQDLDFFKEWSTHTQKKFKGKVSIPDKINTRWRRSKAQKKRLNLCISEKYIVTLRSGACNRVSDRTMLSLFGFLPQKNNVVSVTAQEFVTY